MDAAKVAKTTTMSQPSEAPQPEVALGTGPSLKKDLPTPEQPEVPEPQPSGAPQPSGQLSTVDAYRVAEALPQVVSAGILPDTQVAAADASETGQAGPGPVEGAPANSASHENHELCGADHTASFLSLAEPAEAGASKSSVSQRESFKNADLVVPGVALKKFKLAITEAGNAEGYMAALGYREATLYKIPRPCLCSMTMGDVLGESSAFWSWVAQQVHGSKVGAIFVSDQFKGSVEQVSALLPSQGFAFGSLCGEHRP